MAARRAAPPEDADGADARAAEAAGGYTAGHAAGPTEPAPTFVQPLGVVQSNAADRLFATSPVEPVPADPDDEPVEPEDDRGHDRHHHGPGWAVLWLAIVLVVVAALGYVGYTKGLDWVRNLTAPATDYPGPGEADVTVTIPPDASSSAMANILVNADVVASAKAFTNAVKANPASFINIMAGDHQLQTKMSAVEAYNALANPKLFVQKQQFTIPDGLRDTQVFASINKQTGVPVADLEALATQAGSLGLPTWADTTNAEGYLYPDTYGFDDNPTAQEVLQPMVNEFTQVTNSLDFADKAQANGLTPAQAVVLASIIEKEGSNPTYAADIAQVFYNRLKAGMPLQSDATVLYANNVTGNLTTTDAERANPSPYNTYVHTGLPPGPISNPGKDALTAAVNPTQGDYLYFVVVNPATGQVAFASDAAGHSANVAQFQAWCNANPGKC